MNALQKYFNYRQALIDQYVKGLYTVEVFTEQARLGSAELLLR